MSYQISNGDGLVSFVKAFTGSSDSEEIKDCIFLGELMLRDIELPVMRSDPYDAAFIGTADSYGRIQIPSDMLKPIQFFQTDGTARNPRIVYDRVGDREIIESNSSRYANIDNATPTRGIFSEVGLYYVFSPALGVGDQVNLYYYRAFPFLFSIDDNSATVSNNGILQAFPEGYVYATLHNYYLKRKNFEDAQVYYMKFTDALSTLKDQNNKGKWSGGNRKMSSIWQPRKASKFSNK